jgi:hypothetical protein
MRILSFRPEDGISTDQYESRDFVVTLVLDGPLTDASIHVGYVGSGGLIGRHPAGPPQLFLVVAGEGSVSGSEGPPVAITAGQAAFWEAGEQHETKSEKGLSAVIIQSSVLSDLLSKG